MTTDATGTPVETKLIGSILEDEGDQNGDDLYSQFDQMIDRAEHSFSAPPQTSARIKEAEDGKFVDSRSGERINPKDVRLKPEYSEYYYSQRPIDPRLPPPLLNWSSGQLVSKLYKGLQEKDSAKANDIPEQKADEETSSNILKPTFQKVPGIPFSRANGRGTGFSSLFSSDDPSGIPSYRGPLPIRPHSARPSDVDKPESLLSAGIRLRLHSKTPPGSIAGLNHASSSKLLEQLRTYQERKIQPQDARTHYQQDTRTQFQQDAHTHYQQDAHTHYQQDARMQYQPRGPQTYSPKNVREDPSAELSLGLHNLEISGKVPEDGHVGRRDERRRGNRRRYLRQADDRLYVAGHINHPDMIPYHLPAPVYPPQVGHYHDEALIPQGGFPKGYVRSGGRWELGGRQMGHRVHGQEVSMDYPLPYRGGPPIQADYYSGHGQRDVYWDQDVSSTRLREFYLMHGMGNGGRGADRYNGVGRRRGGRNGSTGRGRHRRGGGSRFRRNNITRASYGRGLNSSPRFDRRDRFDRHDRHDRVDQDRYERYDRHQDYGRDTRMGKSGEMKRNRYQMQNPAIAIAPGEANTIGTSSALYDKWMEEFKTNQTTSITLEDVSKRNMVADLAMDQYGSRFIQQKLEVAPSTHKELSFAQVYPEALRLCTDVFGNYVIQKMFDYGTPEQRKTLAAQLEGHILTLALHMYGCRVVQKAIDVLGLDQKVKVISELHGHVMKCVRDQNGNHVIQKCIEKVPAANTQFIIEAFKNQNVKLAMHPYGCRVIQRLLEHCSSQQRNAMLQEILEHTQGLAKNQFGNYVIQHVLLHGSARHRAAVIKSFYGYLLPLSKHKFASNVIEKCVTHATRQERQQLIEEILGTDRSDFIPPLMGMVRDQFANYVVQRLIDVMDPEQRQYLIQRIHRHLPNLRKIPYGKHIVARIEKIAGNLGREQIF